MTDESAPLPQPADGPDRSRRPEDRPRPGALQPNTPYWISQWRARYRGGNWLVLSGPTCLVMLQPAAPQWSELITTVWEDLLAAASIDALTATLAEFRLNEMPDLAVLFWGPDGMRSLVRGRVSIRDAQSGTSVANGDGIQTWTEIGLGTLEAVRISPEPPLSAQEHGRRLELPLVVGAVQAGEVVLDASAEMRVASPQGTLEAPAGVAGPAGTEPAAPAATEPDGDDGDDGDRNDGDRNDRAESWAPEPDAPWPQRLVLAIVCPPTGAPTEVDRPVLIGRAPAAKRVSGDELPHLVTVPSPSQDISRTHVQVKPEDGQVMVYDMHSTNGTSLIHPDGGRRDIPPGQGVVAGYGTVIDLGDGQTIAIDRPDPA